MTDKNINIAPRSNPKEKKLDSVIGDLDTASRYLRKAAETTKQAGDKSGTSKIEKHADDVEKLGSEFKQLKKEK